MKNIEDIQHLDDKDLIRISEESSVKLPQDLLDAIGAMTLEAEEDAAQKVQTHRKSFIWGNIAAAIAVVVAISITISRLNQPRDTFDDPMLAYAEVEKALNLVGEKMNKATSLAQEKRDKTEEIIKNSIK